MTFLLFYLLIGLLLGFFAFFKAAEREYGLFQSLLVYVVMIFLWPLFLILAYFDSIDELL